MKSILTVLCLLIGITCAEDCSDKANGDMFTDDGCVSYYYECANGIPIQRPCAGTTVFDSVTNQCTWPSNVVACSPSQFVDCHDAAGNAVVTSDGYTKSGDCSDGTYYQCENGEEIEKKCAPGLIYDPKLKVCDWSANIPNCEEATVDADGEDSVPAAPPKGDSTTTKSPTTTTTTTPVDDSTKTTPPVDDSTTTTPPKVVTGDPSDDSTPAVPPKDDSTTTKPPTDDTTTTTPPKVVTGDPSCTDCEIITSTPTTKTTTTTPKPQGDTFVGFVVDDTGSMSNEIVAVKDWIQGCVDGSSTSCGSAPTGGWVITSFNDPSVNRVVGPTLDTEAILYEADGYYPHGGGDCPEKAFTGLHNAANVIPDYNGGCKMYLFTDATGTDSDMYIDVKSLFDSKGCSLIPILTGCCGTCPDACESTSPEYCHDHVTDSRSSSTRVARSTPDDIQTLFYIMSEETGGNIYVTDKPSSPEEMLEFLDEEVTLGFCARADIAGPLPNGYGCEIDCTYMGMCWDKSVSECHCVPDLPCTNDPMPKGTSRCSGAQIVECDENVVEEIIPDLEDCTGYFRCYSGRRAYITCANGTIYSGDSPSHCDHPEYVDPPCGTKLPEDIE